MPLYRKAKNEEGEEVLEEVDFNEVVSEIPDDAFYEDDRYRTVADRDYNRRQRVSELEERLSELQANSRTQETEQPDEQEGEEVEKETDKPAEPREKESPELDMDALYAEFRERLRSEEREKVEREQRVKNIAKENNLPDDVLPLLMKSETPEKDAEVLSRTALTFADTGGGNPGNDTEGVIDVGKLYQRLGLNNS